MRKERTHQAGLNREDTRLRIPCAQKGCVNCQTAGCISEQKRGIRLLFVVMRMRHSLFVPLLEHKGYPAVVAFPGIVAEEGIDRLLKYPFPPHPVQLETPALGAADDRVLCLVNPSLNTLILRILFILRILYSCTH
jgi:hypothetical protein